MGGQHAPLGKLCDQIERRSPPFFDEFEVLLGVPIHSLKSFVVT